MIEEQRLLRQALKYEKVDDSLKSWFNLPTKSSIVSTALRKNGNELFHQAHHTISIHEQIWQLYSESLALAPLASEDLASAYNNRSVFLLHIKKYRESICDIDRALLITQNIILKIKLLCRKTKCLTALQVNENKATLSKAKHWLCKVENEKDKKALVKMVDEAADFMKNFNMNNEMKQCPKNSLDNCSCSVKENKDDLNVVQEILLKKENADPFEFVSLKYNDKFGRHLIAKRDIKPGEIIMVVKPYVTSLNPKNCHAFCGHCLKTCWTNIPCDHCNWCMFCSEECKTEAWQKYHDIECSVVTYLITVNRVPINGCSTTLRSTIMAMREAGSIEKLKKELQEIDNCQSKLFKGFSDGKFLSNSYKSIYSLSHNMNTDVLMGYVDYVLLNLIAIVKSTSLFGEKMEFETGRDLLENEDVVFVGALLLRFAKISNINAYFIEESPCRLSKSSEQCDQDQCCLKGSCLVSASSFCNHSCSPNVARCFTKNKQLMIYSTKPIEKNSQIFDSYVGTYLLTPFQERQSLLKSYNFTCRCPPCQKNWPTVSTHQLFRNISKNISPSEMDVIMKYKDLIIQRSKRSHCYTVCDIKRASSGIQETFIPFKQPSHVTTAFILILRSIFDFLFSERFHVPDECN